MEVSGCWGTERGSVNQVIAKGVWLRGGHHVERKEFVFARRRICIAGFLVGCGSSPQAKEAKFLKKGQEYLAKKDYARATLEFRNAANVMPRDAEPHYQTGLVFLETGNMASAVNAFQKATALDPKHAAAQLS